MSRWLAIGLAAVVGVLAGVLVTLAVTDAGRTDTVVRTVRPPTPGPGQTVITKSPVPDVTGERLDVAKDRLKRQNFLTEVNGGGTFGVIDDSNWQVVGQDPSPQTALETGSTVTLTIERG